MAGLLDGYLQNEAPGLLNGYRYVPAWDGLMPTNPIGYGGGVTASASLASESSNGFDSAGLMPVPQSDAGWGSSTLPNVGDMLSELFGVRSAEAAQKWDPLQSRGKPPLLEDGGAGGFGGSRGGSPWNLSDIFRSRPALPAPPIRPALQPPSAYPASPPPPPSIVRTPAPAGGGSAGSTLYVRPDGTVLPPPPNFIVAPDGKLLPVPRGAFGPVPVRTGRGIKYIDGSGGDGGLHPDTAGLRIMAPRPFGRYQYPNGYGVYMNRAENTVNPFTGDSQIAKSDPLAHIKFGAP